MAEEKPHPIKYMSFGSPLMDCIADVSKEFIERYNIELDSTIHKKLSEIKFLEEFLTQHEIKYIPGGCQFNAMRVFNWMLEKDKTDVVGFLGSVGGNGNYGITYQDLLIQENIVPVFETIDDETTGLCLVLCCNRDRAHITDLGASVSISEGFVERNWDKFKNVKLIYTELFILKTKKEICFKLAELGLRDETTYGFNLPSDFFLKNFTNDIEKLCEYADIIFANEAEALLFCKLLNFKSGNNETIEDIAIQLCKNIPKKNKNKKRIVIVTAGPNPAACCQYDFKEQKEIFSGLFPVANVPSENIVDTNGAGDAFAGGFLSQYVQGKKLDECMKAGHWAASVIIQKRGCDIPMDIKFSNLSI
jgi:adenosine kinase